MILAPIRNDPSPSSLSAALSWSFLSVSSCCPPSTSFGPGKATNCLRPNSVLWKKENTLIRLQLLNTWKLEEHGTRFGLLLIILLGGSLFAQQPPTADPSATPPAQAQPADPSA